MASAPAASSAATAAAAPQPAAQCSGVEPLPARAFTSAPAATSAAMPARATGRAGGPRRHTVRRRTPRGRLPQLLAAGRRVTGAACQVPWHHRHAPQTCLSGRGQRQAGPGAGQTRRWTGVSPAQSGCQRHLRALPAGQSVPTATPSVPRGWMPPRPHLLLLLLQGPAMPLTWWPVRLTTAAVEYLHCPAHRQCHATGRAEQERGPPRRRYLQRQRLATAPPPRRR